MNEVLHVSASRCSAATLAYLAHKFHSFTMASFRQRPYLIPCFMSSSFATTYWSSAYGMCVYSLVVLAATYYMPNLDLVVILLCSFLPSGTSGTEPQMRCSLRMPSARPAQAGFLLPVNLISTQPGPNRASHDLWHPPFIDITSALCAGHCASIDSGSDSRTP